MEELNTIDIEGNECRFQYVIEYGDVLNPHEVTFKVFSIPQDPMRWFSYRLNIIDDQTAKGEMMTTNSCAEFAKKGIPERIIEKAAEKLERNIISSPTIAQEGDYLVGPSYSVWLRLTEQNDSASLDEENHRFILLYQVVNN
ncbi:hypothetical protein [uncultured Aquimarina sp.]|uniref:hypothetical protein n=1 Tax=uncultured Aquimarina sp. TaxID=575652 RepID=UPI0026214682|nr:hypothetical protein [uncultured Aquimarina sp.]